MKSLRFVSVFLGALWRLIEMPGTIPEAYRIKGRINVLQAYRIARACARID